MKHIDPVHKDEQGWWYWTETWADRHGPFATLKECQHELACYVEYLENGPVERLETH